MSEKVLLSKLCQGRRPGLINRPVHDHGAAMKVWGQWWGGGLVTWSWQQETGRQGPSPQPGFNLWPSAKHLASVGPCASWGGVGPHGLQWLKDPFVGSTSRSQEVNSEGILKAQMYLASVCVQSWPSVSAWSFKFYLHGPHNNWDGKLVCFMEFWANSN